ncbi:elongation factor P 5-aminopentanone reductase [Aneurinibacillus uraniidurans]|uniref:elongation factor P 5-aminopentanone reductase n=1 Tax=Aneurinibacillus uraniidurans TaxID=2966586 RepID=UPI002349A903|nr:SDR family oxidoreductase [Aneurinibacillus sp. B1]WCN36651.1 SDR family oxidoreductase [Aneurinibacillus sp. B1]
MEERQRRLAGITGASRGIGAAMAVRFAQDGYDLVLHYNRAREEAECVADRCRTFGAHVTLIQADFSQTDGSADWEAGLSRTPDILVLNAGISRYGLIQDVSGAEWDTMMNVHVRAPFFCARQAVPDMVRRGFGRIITVSSVWGLTGASFEVLYSTAKGAVIAFTKALAKEVAPSGITVNCIAPGMIATEMMANAFSPDELAAIADDIPAGRAGTPEEVAAVAAFLAREEAAYVNGQVISPNGAWIC